MILVDVFVPSLDESFDFMLDENVSTNKVMLEIVDMVAKKVKTTNVGEVQDFMLFMPEKKKPLTSNLTLAENAVTDGSRLLLV